MQSCHCVCRTPQLLEWVPLAIVFHHVNLCSSAGLYKDSESLVSLYISPQVRQKERGSLSPCTFESIDFVSL